MKKIISTLIVLFLCNTAFSQYYIMLAPSLTNTAGTIPDKANVAFEVGKQWDAFSLGFDIGKSTLAKTIGKDTSMYVEFRPNLNVFQQGKFTNTLTTGIGYIFNASLNLVTELTSGIEFAYSPQLHFNTYFGQYYYSGKTSLGNESFFGISVMYYFKESKQKGILNKLKVEN